MGGTSVGLPVEEFPGLDGGGRTGGFVPVVIEIVVSSKSEGEGEVGGGALWRANCVRDIMILNAERKAQESWL